MISKSKISKPNQSIVKLKKEIKETLKNDSKIAIIKKRLKKNIGKIVHVVTTTDNLVINFKGKLTNDESNKFFEVESENRDFIDFTLKNISSVSEHQKLIPDKKQIYIYLKL